MAKSHILPFEIPVFTETLSLLKLRPKTFYKLTGECLQN